MGDIFAIVLPVFVLAGVGYLCAATRFLNRQAGDGLATFVTSVAIPILLFRSLSTAEFSSGSPLVLWGVYFASIITVWIAAMVFTIRIARLGYRAAVISGVAAGFSNLVLVGIPLIERAFGPQGLAVHFLLLAVHLPVMMSISSLLMEWANRADGADTGALNAVTVIAHLAHNLAVNPIIVGILAGVAFRFTGLMLPDQVAQIADTIGRTAGPLALFSLGMGLVKYGIRGNWKPAIVLALLSVIAMPVIVWLLGTYVIAMPVLWFKVALVAAACPTGVNAYLFASYFKVAEGLSSSAIVFATLMTLVTIPFWLSVAIAL